MKKLRLFILFSLICLLLMPFASAYAQQKGSQVVVPDTVKDRHSKLTAKYKSGIGHTCTAILISSTAALTAQHCGGRKALSPAGTIYPGASGDKTPFGYMNVRDYIPHPKYDLALLKGTLRDQDKFYQTYIKPFTTKVSGYTDDELEKLIGQETYTYGYPGWYGNGMQYRSDGTITHYSMHLPLLDSTLPAYEGQSGAGVFTKDSKFVGILVSRTSDHTGNALPFTTEIADWINAHAN